MSEGYERGYAEGLAEGKRISQAGAHRRDVERRIDAASWVYDDPTGQDADNVMPGLFSELIEARDAEIKEVDPDRYAEMKHFEACARYMP